MQRYDVVIIGAGPGGYVAAIRCAQLGLKTAVVDQWINKEGKPRLGGTCLNVGCIPSKALLDSSEKFAQLKRGLDDHGISFGAPGIDVPQMIKRKDQVVNILTGGVETLFLKHKITWYKGRGRLLGEKKIEVLYNDTEKPPETIAADNIIIATGSKPSNLKLVETDNDLVVDSTGALEFTQVPKTLVVIGGGVIGLELGSVWQRLGSKVTVLVRGPQFLAKLDPHIAKEAFNQLSQQGLEIALSASPTAFKVSKKSVTVTYQQVDEEKSIRADKVLVSTGRIPNTEGLNAREIGISLDERGFIEVDEHCQTNIQGIHAIGDVVRGPMLAHKASEEGVAVAERIAGQHSHVNYNTIPWVIYTHPEIAWVGATPQELDKQGISYKAGSYPFKANGRAHAMGEPHGLVKIISDAKTDRILGAHIIGPNASELIAELVVAMEFSASAEDIARTVHAHPTLSESIHEAALAVDKRTIHI
jgi:dihydrolipoamide dehydrogenase